MSGLTHVELETGHLFNIARRRHRAKQLVKSAFWSDKIVTMSIANMYETFMANATIQVRAFTQQKSAAEWLEVPIEILSEFSDS